MKVKCGYISHSHCVEISQRAKDIQQNWKMWNTT